MMSRIPGILCASALLALTGRAAFAQLPPNPEPSAAAIDTSCPHGRLSIYYASGEASASPQAEALISLIGDHARSCSADGLDLIARIDSRVDGEHAIALALQRLNAVAADLVAHGIPVEHIRVAAQSAPGLSAPGLSHVDVIFRKTDDASAVAAPAPAVARAILSDAI
jgi:hypothetical protein